MTLDPIDSQTIANDFDHTQPSHSANWTETYAKLRGQCPHGWSNNHGGFWVATRYQDVMSVAQSSAFSSAKEYDPENGVLKGGNIIPPFPVQPVLPTEAGNEERRGYRSFLNRRFTSAEAEKRREVAKQVARSLIDRVIEKGEIDFVEDLTSPLPALVTMEMFGFDLGNWIDFSEPVHKYMYLRPDHPEYPAIVRKLGAITERLHAEAEDRRRSPRDDLMSYIANGKIDDRALTDLEVNQMALNIVFGGVDTTTALTSNMLRHLGRFPEDRQRLIDDPALRPLAREECIRFYAPVHGVARHAVADVEINGWKIKEGDSIFLAIASANRDSAVFADADRFVIDRKPNRHIGFGAGMHHCLGLLMARAMFDAMLDEVLDRLPGYTLDPGREEAEGSIDKVNGWAHMPATFVPGPVLGGGLAI